MNQEHFTAASLYLLPSTYKGTSKFSTTLFLPCIEETLPETGTRPFSRRRKIFFLPAEVGTFPLPFSDTEGPPRCKGLERNVHLPLSDVPDKCSPQIPAEPLRLPSSPSPVQQSPVHGVTTPPALGSNSHRPTCTPAKPPLNRLRSKGLFPRASILSPLINVVSFLSAPALSPAGPKIRKRLPSGIMSGRQFFLLHLLFSFPPLLSPYRSPWRSLTVPPSPFLPPLRKKGFLLSAVLSRSTWFFFSSRPPQILSFFYPMGAP